MRVVFMGTPHLAAGILEKLLESHEVVGVYTRPDAIRGRGKKLVGSPVKALSEAAGVPVSSPSSLKDASAASELADLKPDVICVAAYGMILPRDVLEVPPLGCLNVHTSLLPRWRGAAPIERAILAGDEQTGVCIMRMEEGLDTGPYCLRKTTEVAGKYLDELAAELARLGGEALLEALDLVQSGQARWTPQSGEGLTYADKLAKGELDVSAGERSATIAAKVRAASPSHPCRTRIAGRSVSLERAREAGGDAPEGVENLAPGQAGLIAKRLFIAACDGALEVERVKPDGKSSMDARSFSAGIQGLKGNYVQWGSA